jgi:pyruvate kinase
VIDNLHLMSGDGARRRTESSVGFRQGRSILEANAEALLGPARAERSTRILVTMPSEAADDYELVADLIARGMDCARINCAHDDPEGWGRMADNIRRASAAAGRPCMVLMDLPGPKLRTGPIQPGPRVLRLRPQRDVWGRPRTPATALLVAEQASAVTTGAVSTPVRIPVDPKWLDGLLAGDRIRFSDTRDASRTALVTRIDEAGAWIEIGDTAYLATGTRLLTPEGRVTSIGLLPELEQALVLRVGDVLTLTRDLSPAVVGELHDEPGAESGSSVKRSQRVARIGCTVPEVLDALALGHRVFFDDGKIGGEVVAVRDGEVDIEITTAAAMGSRLRAEKGINVPDCELNLPALGPDDEGLLRFVVDHADIVGLSFTQSPLDVAQLQDRLAAMGHADMAIVLKIETVRGFASLPDILLAALASQRVGVMVARGDLAVECGFERLAEVQEEMLWVCEAAHVPVIWATQVLDQMARTGRPSRAEISDAAMSGRSECVMLNKGPFITETVSALNDILCRMGSHQRKKTTLLRRLTSWWPIPE